jgi:hypothetical protein
MEKVLFPLTDVVAGVEAVGLHASFLPIFPSELHGMSSIEIPKHGSCGREWRVSRRHVLGPSDLRQGEDGK